MRTASSRWHAPWGHAPVRGTALGFIVNHAGCACLTGGPAHPRRRRYKTCPPSTASCARAAGFCMGPASCSTSGSDVSHPVMELGLAASNYQGRATDPRRSPASASPPPCSAERAARLLRVSDSAARWREEAPAPAARPPRVFVAAADAACREQLASLVQHLGGVLDAGGNAFRRRAVRGGAA